MKNIKLWQPFYKDWIIVKKHHGKEFHDKIYELSLMYIKIADTWTYYLIKEWMTEHKIRLDFYGIAMEFWRDQIETAYQSLN